MVENDQVNPYMHNLRGSWQQANGYAFDGLRNYSANNSREDGYLSSHQPFWHNVSNNWYPIYNNNHPNFNNSDVLGDWIRTASNTEFDENGNLLESSDALDLRSSMRVGYNKQIGVSQSANAYYRESGFEGFEDYYMNGYYDDGSDTFDPFACVGDLLDFSYTPINLSEEAHTGKYAFLLNSIDFIIHGKTWDGTQVPETNHGMPYTVQAAEILPGLTFISNQASNKYVCTYWIKEAVITDPTTYSVSNPNVFVAGAQLMNNDIEITKSNIIDGWQRIELIFNIPANTPNNSTVTIEINDNKQWNIYIDDIQIQPYDSEIESNVVDAMNWRPSAKLDGRDYSTVMQYDENGKLVQTMMETERGKQTVQESRSGHTINQ